MAAVKEVKDLTTLYQLVMMLPFLRPGCGGAERQEGTVTRLHTPESSTAREPRTLTTYARPQEEAMSHKRSSHMFMTRMRKDPL